MSHNNGIDYKKKYIDLRERYVDALNTAFMSGYRQGANEAQNMAAQQAQAMATQGGENPQNSMGPSPEGQSDQQLDSAINELEQLVNKSEPSIDDLKKSIETLKNERMHSKLLKKTMDLKPVFLPPKGLSQSYSHNLPDESKQAVSMHQKIVDDIMMKWENEQNNSTKDIANLISSESNKKE